MAKIKTKQKKETRKKESRKKGFWNYMKSETSFKKINWKVLIVSLIVVFVVAGIGSLFTNVGPWYESIKPSFAPPNYVFPIVWTVLFYLIGISLYYSWVETEKKWHKMVAIFYGANFILNILWSFIFFYTQSPRLALGEILILWVSILALIMFNWKKSKTAAYFLIPYFLWVSFAIILNYWAIP
jgi:translocator protein